jgi:signal transduction histidine kinase
MPSDATNQTRVLLAEDSQTQALRVRHVLEEAGCLVTHAADGTTALASARAIMPDLIISDVMMPGMDGYALCAACKDDAALRRVPFVLLTSLDTSLDMIRGLQARADRYLIKPVVPAQILAIVRDIMASPTPEAQPPEQPPTDITLDGQTYPITASREQITTLLLSTCEATVRRNHELLRVQDALRRHQETMESRVNERTLELSSANERLQEVVGKLEAYERMRSEFIENVSHELRTPLAAMSYAVNNLRRGILGPLPAKLQPYLSMIGEECDILKSTVGDILDLERIDAQTLSLNRMKLPFHAWVRRSAGELRVKAAEKNLTLSIPGPEVCGFVDADPLKLERVIVSVVKNAVHFTPEAGHVDILVRRVRDESWIEACITDNGIGVAPEHLPRLTDRYYRVGEQITGTGLGLALCKEILERMGGEIELLSPPPGKAKGTQVLIRLPLVSAPSILAVDDSKTVQLLLEQQLKASGYAVLCCGSAEQALERIASTTPDMLIVDSILPGMDGAELVARVKTDRALRHMPILMITGGEIDGARRKTLEEFRVPVLGKPWLKEELIARIEDTIYGKHYLER